MKKLILATVLCLSSTFAWSQNVVTDRWGQQVVPPVFNADAPDMPVFGRHETTTSTQERRKVLGKPTPGYLTHKGAPRILTILVNFSDSAMTVNQPKKAFYQFFNQQGALDDLGNGNALNYGSVRQYFSDMSGGEFTPQFDIYGPVNLPRPMAYYGASSSGSSSGEKPKDLVNDALALIVDSVSDASVYDNDADSLIDCVYIIYAGMGQNNGGGANTVWAKTGAADGSFKGLKLNWYSMASELSPFRISDDGPWAITGIGVPCHELSHAMGLPDIYPTVKSAQIDNQEMEYWDLMDGGEYVYNGFQPTAYTAWEKMQMEWPINVVTLTDSENDVTMNESTERCGVAYRIQNDQEPLEYFLLENIQNVGWNRWLPGHGLLVYHVNEVGNSVIGTYTHINNTAGEPGMAIVPADSVCLSSYIKANSTLYRQSQKGDPFPGTSMVTALNDNMGIPNFYWYAGTQPPSPTNNKYHKVDKALTSIKEDNGAITFNFINGYATGIRDIKQDQPACDNMIYSISGQPVGKGTSSMQPGIYIRNGKKFVVK